MVHPALFYGYRGARVLRKWIIAVLTPIKARLGGRYATHTIVVAVCLLVTVTNIQALKYPVLAAEDLGRHSILAKVSGHEMEDLVIEEASPVEFAKEVSYLGAHAVRPRAEYLGQTPSNHIGSPEEDTLNEETTPTSVLVNAIRVQTDVAVADSSSRTRTGVIEHVVQEGENIGSIAQLYGLQTITILTANELSARSVIRPGQKLKILPVDGILYTVRKGDTLVTIANKYKSVSDQIMTINGMAESGSLSVGQTLVLPGGKMPFVVPPAPSRITTNLRQVFTASPDANSGTRLLWPTSARRITQYYNRKHTGVDIGAPVGTPIYAADDGVVSFAGWNNGGYGRMVLLDHGNGLYTRYGHASRVLVQTGDVVKRGDVIMLMGSTGRSTGSHLHFEVLSGGVYSRVNPFDYIQ